ncbi:hypothetical protein IB286_02030 [Spongiibacter sp. KMU-158]|uniref:Uncharacterized protein n=1 Tax=Spongiibacter pelagi TaxID=2760804 RepID=A0A927C073_9GAMM|nr:hypothetical protein [Spongiibacter pelagi]MBD2857768.1 hypothetical protein [Spongiibacter pelagi]
MLKLPILSPNLWIYALVIATLSSLPIAGSLLLSRQQFAPITLSNYQSYRCQTGGEADATFNVLTLTALKAKEFADRLCANPVLGQYYGEVAISWHPRAFLQIEHLLNGQYQLFWNRRHIVAGLTPEAQTYYLPIVDSPRYTMYWASYKQAPEITPEYLADKRIGFSEDHQSMSFYLRPMAALAAAGIELNSEQKRFYPGPKALMDAFYRGDIDLVTSGGDSMQAATDRKLYFTLMDKNVPSGTWYLQRNQFHPGLACELSKTLRLFDSLFEQGHSTPTFEGSCP